MRLTPLTTLTSASSMLSTQIRRIQDEAARLQTEVASGRLHDVGKELGSETGGLVSFRQEVKILSGTIDVNKGLAIRLDASQASLNNIVSNANEFLSALMSGRGDPRNAEILVRQAEESFKSFISSANTSHGGIYLFAGINTTSPPINDYFSTPMSAARTAVEAAFVSEFGLASTDPAVESIPVSSMQAFIGNAFQNLFDDPAWSSDWSTATQQTSTSVITPDRSIQSSITAHEKSFRKIAAAYALVVDAGTRQLNDAAYQGLVDEAAKLVAEGVAGFGELQGVLGAAESQLDQATAKTKIRVDLIERLIGEKEGVDLSELSVRLNTLLNHLEATYAVTGRIQSMSLLKAI
jgi:flagellar hook-associated protein 3 FlgL